MLAPKKIVNLKNLHKKWQPVNTLQPCNELSGVISSHFDWCIGLDGIIALFQNYLTDTFSFQVCRCFGGRPELCATVRCGRPTCRLGQAVKVKNRCCEWVCLEDHLAGANGAIDLSKVWKLVHTN